MKYLKENINYFIAIIVSVGLLLWFIASGYDYKIEIVAGILAFLGAIIGGTFTLTGVLYTIQNNTKREYFDKLPKDISNIDEAINIIEEKVHVTIKKSFIHTHKEKSHKSIKFKGNMIYLNSSLDFNYTEEGLMMIDSMPHIIKDILSPINIDVYQKYIEFNEKLERIKNICLNAEDETRRLLYEEYRDLWYFGKSVDEIGIIYMHEKEEQEEVDEFILKFFDHCEKADVCQLRQIHKVYEDLLKSLKAEREKMYQSAKKGTIKNKSD